MLRLFVAGFACAPLVAMAASPPSMDSSSLIVLQPVTVRPGDAAAKPSARPGNAAEIEVGGVRFAARSGARIEGVRPRFPSAAVVIAQHDAHGWRDVAFADETPDVRVEDIVASTEAGKLVVSYRGMGPDGAPWHRAVELPLPVRLPPPSDWRRRPAYPQSPGMAGAIAGMHGGALIIAGGANFPEKMPWDGGRKAYYGEIFVLAPGDSAWRSAGRLPQPRAYAAVASLVDGVLVAGGENADGVLDDVLVLRWNGKSVQIGPGPKLPAPRTSPAAAVLDGRVYVAGGYAAGPATGRPSAGDFWCLDPAEPAARWKTLPAWPGRPRAQAVMAALDDAVYLISGLDMAAGSGGSLQPSYLRDAYRFRRGAWERLPDLPWSAVAAPSPAPVSANPGRIFVLGGVDGRQAGKLPRDTRVPEDILYFDVGRGEWRLWPERWPDPVVTAPAVRWGGEWWIVSGEIMAGVRTTSVWSWTPVNSR